MHNILILEDDHVQCEWLKSTILNQYPNWTIQTASDYMTAKNLIEESIQRNLTYSLYLFDIRLSSNMDNRDGFRLAKEVRRHSIYFRTPILFLSAITNEEGFALSEFHCYNYITKPYTSTDILNQIEQMLTTGYLENILEISDRNRIQHRIRMNEIYAVESNSHILTIYTLHGNFATRAYSLKKMSELLNADFVQCHRRILINKSHISSYDRTSRYLQVGNRSVTVGRSYQKDIETFFQK